jgi:gamma-glutamyltranspeptidase/glutathione hydrolase
VVGGRSVGVPGTVRMLEMAHRQHGKLPWAALFQPPSSWPRAASRSARACTRWSGRRPEKRPGGRRLFLQARRQRARRGLPCATPNWPPCCAASPPRAARPCTRRDRPGHRGQGAAAPTNPGKLGWPTWRATSPKARGPVRGLPRPRAGLPAVRLPAAELGRHRRGADPGHPEPPTPPACRCRTACPHGADWLHLYTEAARLAFADRALYVADPTSCSPGRQLDEPARPGLPRQPPGSSARRA